MTEDLFGNVSEPTTSAAAPPGGGSLGSGDHSGLPLAVRLRPRTVDEIVGQQHLLGAGSPLRRLATGAAAMSVFLWGPPGVGKTTIASVVSRSNDARFVEISAVTAGVKDVRAVLEQARKDLAKGQRTVLFVDEVHRFSKAQQDVLLPAVENRIVTLIAATTENPSFSVISPLLSRSLLLTLKPLTEDDITSLVDRALTDERGLRTPDGGLFSIDAEARDALLRMAGGDARRVLTYLEEAAAGAAAGVGDPDPEPADSEPEDSEDAEGAESGTTDSETDDPGTDSTADAGPADADRADTDSADADTTAETVVITLAAIERAVDRASVRYDADGDQHYDVISAFIKSLRGSDVNASLHYLARMIEAGEDARFIARRLIVLASEDIGTADSTVLQTCVAAGQAVQLIGMPEARINLAHAVVACAMAPKSNASYMGLNAAVADVRAGRIGQVPPHLRDAHYGGAKQLGHGKGYKYAHDAEHGVAAQQYLPDELADADYYHPTDHGQEANLQRRLEVINRLLGRTR